MICVGLWEGGSSASPRLCARLLLILIPHFEFREVTMLTQDEIRQYRDEGFLLFPSLIQGEKLTRYKSVFDELVEQGRSIDEQVPHWSLELDQNGDSIPGFLHKIQGVCTVDSRVLELAKEPEILDRVEALAGSNIDCFGTKFFPKLPNGGTPTGWHQDNFYFGTVTDRIVTCGIYLEETDVQNGCLRIVPRSHRDAVIREHTKIPARHGSWTQVDNEVALDLEMTAGTVVLFSANLLHGSHDNISDRTRYCTAWHYIPADLGLDRFPRGEYEDRHIVREE